MRATAPLIVYFATLLAAGAASAHGGGVDKTGCHVEAKSGQKHCHLELAAKKKVSPCTMQAPKAGQEGFFFGPVTDVIDGDTFKAKVQGVVMNFRLSAIDAPEKDQPYGPEAKDVLAKQIAGKEVVMWPTDTDKYGRTIVHVWIDASYVNRELMKVGAAWFDAESAPGDCLFWVEQKARSAKAGLWAKPHMEPWEWRKTKKSNGDRLPATGDRKSKNVTG